MYRISGVPKAKKAALSTSRFPSFCLCGKPETFLTSKRSGAAVQDRDIFFLLLLFSFLQGCFLAFSYFFFPLASYTY